MKYSWLSLAITLSYIRLIYSACTTPYSEISADSGSYCIKCDTSCLTCYDNGVNNCVTCPDDFIFDEDTSYCTPPANNTVDTLEFSYRYRGFSQKSGWSGGTPTDCEYTTILKSTGGNIVRSHTLSPHYQVRILASLWWINSFTGDITITVTSTAGTLKTITTSAPSSVTNNTRYCLNSRATNIDETFSTNFATSITVTISGSGSNWGIRQYIFMEYLCHQATCATCDGPEWDDCLSCTDSHNRRLIDSGSECRCDPDKSYFKHPDSNTDYCVKPCPSVPSTGQTYGDPYSQQCVSFCPTNASATKGITFADDVTAECVDLCPATITMGSQSHVLFHDMTNHRCVTNCPDTQPYSWWSDRQCYSTCPDGYYKYDKNMSCVSQCPSDHTIALFKDSVLKACVDDCEGVDWWADYLTGECTATCSGTDYFEDNTTTRNRCTQICPFPQYFGDPGTEKCIDHCYGDRFADTHPSSKRHCVDKCSGGYFGVQSGNRLCVPVCPDETWGEWVDMTCLTDPTQCDNDRYGDNHTHTCVDKGSCSIGRYTDDISELCVIDCPENTYSFETSMHCQTSCTGTYFADPGKHKCVQICETQDLFSDVDSGNMCVDRCNQTGSTPYRDESTKKCVSVCPDDPYTFSDPDEEACVYNCSLARYSDDLSDPSDKRCVLNCVSPNWGDNSTGYGICVARCPENPPLFGDTVDGFRVCVEVCGDGLFGDQDPNNLRQCVPTCPDGWFAQSDDLRRCVTRCNSTTYGYNKICEFPEDCPDEYVGDPSTNLCVDLCPASEGTFADNVSKLCVQLCPINDSIIYYADPTDRWCRDTCDQPTDLYGNNQTQTCEEKCLDFQSFADAQHPNRFCIALCTDTTDIYYRNNYTKECVVSTDCPDSYFGDNVTRYCVAECPFHNGSQTWGFRATQTCVQKCYGLWGDDSTGVPLCVSLCPALPMKWSYDPDMLCLDRCPEDEGLYGEDFTRTCVSTCPKDPANTYYTYAYNDTRRCLEMCPQGTFSDYQERKCWYYPENCTYGWGDDYNNSCTHLCTGPDPWDSYGDNLTSLCTIRCSAGSWADNYTGTRICVEVCPGTYDNDGVPDIGSHDSFGDNNTQRCVQHCVTPSTWADWQTHRCESRCTGDDSGTVPTYSQNVNGRCVIALWCPQSPDKTYGDNNTRSCLTSCFYNSSYTQWADNITRTCVPQCHNYTNGTNSVITTFYGDLSTSIPICVVICPEVPRSFGENSTNQCVYECPDNQYGDQTGNRSCVPVCPRIGGVIWFTQITEQLCVKVCQEGTWGNIHGEPHCETVPTDCQTDQYADNSTNLCVPLCPEDQNYFGDPSTKLCVDKCPTLLSPVVNVTAGINMAAGHLYADYSTRLCVYTCPHDHGDHGTFGDNTTNTCVQRCPDGTYGDSQTGNRHCVTECTDGTYADNLTNRCVSDCPASPPYFGEDQTWTCVKVCPNGTWADASTRTCVSNCPANEYRLSVYRTQCVEQCPSNPDMYGDPATDNCVYTCTDASYPYADPTDRTCKGSCLPLFQYNNRCVKYCPSGYYADALGDCVEPTDCDANTYADNRTTKCVGTCTGGSFADPNSRYCIAVCPQNWYGDAGVCVQDCVTSGTSSSTITQVCQSTCPDYTYHENSTCKDTCQYGYANDVLGTCAAACPTNIYADPRTHDCVAICHDDQTDDTADYFRNTDTGFCVDDCQPEFKDFVTGNCVEKCSEGSWGYTGNYTCISQCPSGEYGYEGANQRTCYLPSALPGYASSLFGDPESKQYVAVCPTSPYLYFGDRTLKQCVQTCPSHSSTDYYGDPDTRQCESVCTNDTFYTADPNTGRCQLRCSHGSYRFNDTPICVNICPDGYADATTSICVDVCPVWADTFGFHNTTSGQRICVDQCPQNYYSQYTDRTCSLTCAAPYFAYNATHQCVEHCVDSFADPNNHKCMDACNSILYPNADNSTNQCVSQCPSQPDYYADNNVCVFYCTDPLHYADPDSRQCVARCPNITAHNSYANPYTGRCVETCPLEYYGDNSTNLCVRTCPPGSFADNQTRKCVEKCPQDENLYGDPFLHVCAYTCSNGYFGSQVNQECIQTCDDTYWGDYLTTLCVSECPSKDYYYGENDTRTCVHSCKDYSGFADNYTRLCRDKCQDTITPQTYRDTTSMSCVEICPDGYYMENSTNECLEECLTGYADNYSRYCVAQCPDDPETYADTTDNICLYECRFGQFSDNDTNMCVPKCPSTPDFYGDPHTGRCVYFCTEGSYAQNDSRECEEQCPPDEYADNLTRRCVSDCPPSESTFADDLSNDCVRVCPQLFYADNSTQDCVSQCPVLSSGTLQTYADNITRYCVTDCPYPYFGLNNTHKCVLQCPVALNLYGHPEGRVCVTVTNCYDVSGQKYFADSVSRTCVQKCPLTLWADFNTYKCVDTCVGGQYRNHHDQTCVTNCPSDPDEYADTTTDNCVRKCPAGSYAYVHGGGFRQCVTDCKSYNLIKDNITNTCVSLISCPTDPYMYGDWNLGACVLDCSINYFRDNSTQTCVPTCPADWQYFGQTSDYTCVSLCDDGLFADALANRECKSSCSNNYYKDEETSSCVQHCSEIKPFYYEDDGSYSCVDICPGQSYAYNPSQRCLYTSGGVSTCPGSYFADRLSQACVEFCPHGTFATTSTKYCESTCTGLQFADVVTRTCTTSCSLNYFSYDANSSDHKCVQYCPSPYFAQNSSKSCVLGCTSLLALQTTQTCQSYCPEPYFADYDEKKCVLECETKYADYESRQCVSPCPSPSYANPLNRICQLLCPENYFGRNGSRTCQLDCQDGSYADPHLRICVSQCSIYPVLYADDRTNQCVQVCDGEFAYTQTRECVTDCPNVSSLVYLADQSNRMCVLQCTNQQISFADYSNNQCTTLCPLGTFASNLTKQCVDSCPVVPNDTFSDNSSRICMDICHLGSFGDPENLNCVAACWWPRFADPTTRQCVQFCPDGYFAQNSTATCREQCLPNTYADESTHICVAQCPAIQDLFKYDDEWKCVKECPSGYYADEGTRTCIQICDSTNGTYAYDLTNQCLMECPVPYRGFDENHTCILNCPSLYFYNITRNVCTKCPDECLVCTGPLACLQCQVGYNLFNGICNISCTPTDTLITYSHPTTGVCMEVCPHGYYGDNSSYTCTGTCPAKQYGNSTTQLCEHCPSTCSLCKNQTYCTSCQSNATLAIDNMCYSDCNSTAKYYFNNKCYSTCPDGTYLSYTNVHCQSCSALCQTCSSSPTNCTSCHDRYLYNQTCVTQCPDNMFGDVSFVCQSCSSSSKDICDSPLSFTTELKIENFQYVMSVTFNQNVSIEKQIEDILKVKLKVKRRLLSDSLADLINNGVTYTYQILSNGTLKLYLSIQTNLDNPEFVVQITDPTAIVSIETNGTLQDTQESIQIEKIQYYPPEQGEQIGIKKAAMFAVVFLLLLYALTFIWTDVMVKVIQWMQILCFHAIILTQIPASLFFYLLQLKLALFQFLPNWPSQSIASDLTIHTTSNQKTMDVFLDYNFSRNVGQIFLFLVIFSPLWFLFLILSNRRVVDHKLWNSIFTTISNHRFKLMVVNDICSVFYVPILWFGFYQMQELFGEDFLVFNGISCLLFVIFAIIIPFIWLWAWVKKQSEQLQEYYGFMCSRMKDDVPGAKLQICVTYWYLLFMVIWLTALYQFPVPQMVMLIATNVAYFLYMVITRPYIMSVNTIMTAVFTLLAITLQSLILYIQINNASLTGTSKSELIYPFLIVMSIVLMVFILWSLWKCVYEVMEVWRFFTKTQFYKAYADPQIEQQKQQTQQYNKYEKMAINIQPKEGDVIVDKIYKECNDQGFNVIKVRKKVLKKKKKPKTRVKHEEKKEIDEQDLQYMKVNKINAFDYDYEENFQPTKVKNTIKRTFDDDLKDAVSDEDDDFKPIKTKKQKQTHTIEVQEHEKPVQDLSNLDDGISNNQLLQDQGRVSQMSQFRKSKGFHQELEDYQSVNFGQSSQMWRKNEKFNDEQNRQKPIQEIKQQQSVKDIDELLKEEESKEKKLGFLFDDFEEDQ